MILSGRDLRWYVETGRLKIEPVTDDQLSQILANDANLLLSLSPCIIFRYLGRVGDEGGVIPALWTFFNCVVLAYVKFLLPHSI